MQQKHNELKEKILNLENRHRVDNLRVGGIPEYEEESWGRRITKGTLQGLGLNNIRVETAHQVGNSPSS